MPPIGTGIYEDGPFKKTVWHIPKGTIALVKEFHDLDFNKNEAESKVVVVPEICYVCIGSEADKIYQQLRWDDTREQALQQMATNIFTDVETPVKASDLEIVE